MIIKYDNTYYDLINEYEKLHLIDILDNEIDLSDIKERIKKKMTSKYQEKCDEIISKWDEIRCKKYWNDLQVELESEPTEWKTTIMIIKEIRDRFMGFSQKTKNKISSQCKITAWTARFRHQIITNSYIRSRMFLARTPEL